MIDCNRPRAYGENICSKMSMPLLHQEIHHAETSVQVPARVAAVAGEAETPIVYCDLPIFASLLPDDLYVALGV